MTRAMLRPRFGHAMRTMLQEFVPARVTRLLCLIGLLGMAGCSQDAGEECQLDSDCSSGLHCERAMNSDRGTCQGASQPAAAPQDSGTKPEPESDSGSSAQPEAGAGSGDAG
jgi:hypothetical protein